MKVKAKDLDPKVRMQVLDTLYTAAGTVQGRNAMKTFLRDVLTESERIMVGRRLLIARELLSGSEYRTISAKLNVGFDTIGRVERWLQDQMPGYEDALAGLEREFKKRDEKRLLGSSAIARLKKKYPLHFLLFSAPKLKNKSGDF